MGLPSTEIHEVLMRFMFSSNQPIVEEAKSILQIPAANVGLLTQNYGVPLPLAKHSPEIAL